MIVFSNGRSIEYFMASGSFAFGKGWFWDWPGIWLGAIRPELFGIVVKSLTLYPRKGNLRMSHPWTCVRLIPGGAVNKVGLTNKGFYWWIGKVVPKLDFTRYNYIASLHGEEDEVVTMASELNQFKLAAVEINPSCPNTGQKRQTTDAIIRMCRAVHKVSRHPLIVKVSADQEYVAIAEALVGTVEAMSFNTLAWEKVFKYERTPLHWLESRVKGGGGGVSGKPL